MSEMEDQRPSSDADEQDRHDAAHESQVAAVKGTLDDRLCGVPDSFEPKLRGPEIPNAVVSADGVLTVRIGDTEIFETAKVEFFLGII